MTNKVFIFKRAAVKPTKLTKPEISKALRKFSQIVNKRQFGKREFDAWKDKPITADSIMRIYDGSWSMAMEEAGLKAIMTLKQNPEEMVRIFKECWEALDAEPSSNQFERHLNKINSRYCLESYRNYFGGLERLRQRIVDHQNGKISNFQLHAKHEKIYKKERISPKLRHQVLERDGEKCVKCGRSPKTHPGVALNAHHKEWEVHGGPTILENLETLCDDCHEGLHAQPNFEKLAR
jgi:predicted phosphohydrolase